MGDFRSQFSLDWLGAAPVADSKSAGNPPSLDEAIDVYSRPIIQILRVAPEHRMNVRELAPQAAKSISHFTFENFMGVIKRLNTMGVVEIEKEDAITGNHLIRLP